MVKSRARLVTGNAHMTSSGVIGNGTRKKRKQNKKRNYPPEITTLESEIKNLVRKRTRLKKEIKGLDKWFSGGERTRLKKELKELNKRIRIERNNILVHKKHWDLKNLPDSKHKKTNYTNSPIEYSPIKDLKRKIDFSDIFSPQIDLTNIEKAAWLEIQQISIFFINQLKDAKYDEISNLWISYDAKLNKVEKRMKKILKIRGLEQKKEEKLLKDDEKKLKVKIEDPLHNFINEIERKKYDNREDLYNDEVIEWIDEIEEKKIDTISYNGYLLFREIFRQSELSKKMQN